MRTFELRVTNCAPKRRWISTREQIYPRHLNSFPLFGSEAHGFWTAKEDVEKRFFVLAFYATGEEPGEVVRRYMQSAQNLLRIYGALIYPTSLALNRQSSNLQQGPLLSDGKRKGREDAAATMRSVGSVPACPVPRVVSRFGVNVAGALLFEESGAFRR
jgi:hypothetical protein